MESNLAPSSWRIDSTFLSMDCSFASIDSRGAASSRAYCFPQAGRKRQPSIAWSCGDWGELCCHQRRVVDNEKPAGVFFEGKDVCRVGARAVHLIAGSGCDVFKTGDPGNGSVNLNGNLRDIDAHEGRAFKDSFPVGADIFPPRETFPTR